MADDPLDPSAQTEPGAESDPAPDRDHDGGDGGDDGDDAAASPLEAAPRVARLAAGTAWRTAGWSVGAYARGMNWLTRATLSEDSTAELLNEARAELREQVRSLLGFDEIEEQLLGGRKRERTSNGGQIDPLRKRGYELLERSADVDDEEDRHPAYERILAELAPDEARILRLLATKGAQPSVDVKTWRPLGVGSQKVASGLTMIGAEAGCRFPDRSPAYLDNVFRLGLIWFSREPLKDPNVYQVLEAQPDVIEASRRAGRATTVRRTIHLTPFGIDFCETCLPLSTAEFEALESSRPAEEP